MAINCFWITGLSAAGKSTISNILTNYLRSRGESVILLDGDELQEVLLINSFKQEDRLETALKYSRICSLIVKQQINVVIAVIGLFNEVHQWNRKNIPGYVEVFIDVPMKELRKRDPKKIYKRAFDGKLKNVYGVDIDVDFPKDPDVHLIWSAEKNVEIMMKEFLGKINK